MIEMIYHFARCIRCLIFSLLTLSASMLGAQSIISGVVTDISSGEPLIGATVLADNTNLGTVTDVDGKYSLVIDSESLTLTISYVGYKSQDIDINARLLIDISMVEGEFLDEVVVVGYGKQSRTKLTSAVSTVDEKALKKLPVANVSNGLEGLAAGLFVRQGSGEPGFSGSSFEVRNFGNALVIVDGAPGSLDELDAQ